MRERGEREARERGRGERGEERREGRRKGEREGGRSGVREREKEGRDCGKNRERGEESRGVEINEWYFVFWCVSM